MREREVIRGDEPFLPHADRAPRVSSSPRRIRRATPLRARATRAARDRPDAVAAAASSSAMPSAARPIWISDAPRTRHAGREEPFMSITLRHVSMEAW